MYALLIQISSQNLAFDSLPPSNFDFLLQLLPVPRPLQWIWTKSTGPVHATTLILKKQVHSPLEAKHDPSSISSHSPATFPSSTDQVEALLDAPAPTTTSPSPTLYLGASAGLDSAPSREQLSTPFLFSRPRHYSFIYKRLRHLRFLHRLSIRSRSRFTAI